MRIQAADLALHLARGLSSVYLVFGPEPVQHRESIEAIRLAAKERGFVERESFAISPNFEWSPVFATLCTPSLFCEKRLIECHLSEGKIGKATLEALRKLATLAPSADLIFVLSGTKMDSALQNSAGFKQLDSKGCTIFAPSLSAVESMRWIEKRLIARGLHFSAEMLSVLAERTEGNLLAASQAIEKLVLYSFPDKYFVRESCLSGASLATETKDLSGKLYAGEAMVLDPAAVQKNISLEDVRQAIAMDARFTVYEWIDAALSGSVSRTTHLFWSLKNEDEEPGLLLWALIREIRLILAIFYKTQAAPLSSQLLSAQGVWRHRETLIRNFMARFSIPRLQALLVQAKNVDDIIRGRVKGSAWDFLWSLSLTLTGKL